MKRVLLFSLAVCVFASSASAWEFGKNPDRRPSWAIGYWKGKVTGTAQRTELLSLVGFLLRDAYDTPTEIETQIVKPSVRLPLSDDVTLDLDWTYIVQNFDSSNKLGTYKGELKGGMFGGTFRKYF